VAAISPSVRRLELSRRLTGVERGSIALAPKLELRSRCLLGLHRVRRAPLGVGEPRDRVGVGGAQHRRRRVGRPLDVELRVAPDPAEKQERSEDEREQLLGARRLNVARNRHRSSSR